MTDMTDIEKEKDEADSVRAAVEFVCDFVSELPRTGKLKFFQELQAKFSREFNELDKRRRTEMLGDELR